MTASSDTNRPGTPSGPRTPDTGKPVSPAATPPKAADPTKPEPPKADSAKPELGKAESGKIESGKIESGRAESNKVEPGKPDLSKTDATKVEAVRAEPGKVDPVKPAFSKPDLSRTEAAKPEAPKPEVPKAAALGSEATKTESAKTEGAKTEAPRTGGFGASPGATPRPNAAVTDGPIIDLKAKRLPDPPQAAKHAATGAPSAASDLKAAATVAAAAAGIKAGDAKAESKPAEGKTTESKPALGASDSPKSEAAKSESSRSEPAKPATGAAPRITPAPAASPAPAARGPGFGSIATAGLLGGVIGAGLLFGVQRAGLVPPQDDSRLAALDQRIAALAPRDELAGLDKRVAANEVALKAVPEAVATAKQALQKANATPVAVSDGVAPPAAAPADLVARLDSLDQRVSALQEEPGQQGGDATKLVATQTGAVTALDERLKALEGKVETGPKAAQPDLTPKLAALQSDVDARTKANAEANEALTQKLAALQQSLDQRVKAATEAVQAATAASQQAVDANKTQAAETAKAVERQLQAQSDKIAGLDKAVASRADAATVQTALRVVAADRIATALNTGAPYADALSSLRNLEPGDPARLNAVAVFADKGAPTARGLSAEFRPIAERIAATRRAAQSRSVAESGDFSQKLMSMAESIVQVRKVDTPAAASATGPSGDSTVSIQEALDGGDIQAAAQAFAALPEDTRAQAGDFGTKLASRAAAATAAQGLLADAFKAIPAQAASR